jgi:ElaB/YqjD/DUF883 family membrane-anchored ribosome-binding protein
MASVKQVAATAADMHDDLRMLRDDLAQLTKQVARLLSASGHEAAGDVKTRVRQMRDDIDERVSAAGDRSREVLSGVSENVGQALDETLRKHPFAILALTVGLGLLFGAVSRR